MDIVKEAKATDQFNSLSERVRGCQNDEPYEDCNTRLLLDAMIGQCNCLPFNIRTDNKVQRQSESSDLRSEDISLQSMMCDVQGYQCIQDLQEKSSQCLKNCEGIEIVSYKWKENLSDDFQQFKEKISQSYDLYKKNSKLPDSLAGK